MGASAVILTRTREHSDPKSWRRIQSRNCSPHIMRVRAAWTTYTYQLAGPNLLNWHGRGWLSDAVPKEYRGIGATGAAHKTSSHERTVRSSAMPQCGIWSCKCMEICRC